jgi:predicted ATPase
MEVIQLQARTDFRLEKLAGQPVWHVPADDAAAAALDRAWRSLVGRENVMAGVDCGFGTFAGRVQVDTKIVWMKLASLAEGAALASKQLWAKAA